MRSRRSARPTTSGCSSSPARCPTRRKQSRRRTRRARAARRNSTQSRAPLRGATPFHPQLQERLGAAAPKGSLQIAFWAAVQELSTQLGATQPAHLGILHPVPVLVAPGAVLLLFCHEHYLPSSVSKGLKWMPTASAAAKLFGAGVTCAAFPA